MSSIENPSAPRTPSPVAEASEVHDDDRRLPSGDESYQEHAVVQDDSVSEDFLDQHLRPASTAAFSLTKKMKEHLDAISKAGTVEDNLYQPAASLLTAISKQVYSSLSDTQKSAHRIRQHIRDNMPGHLTFIDHHATAPTHFPKLGCITNNKDAPDLLGVYDVGLFTKDKESGVYSGVPHHRVEAIVEAKSETGSGGRRQATTYAYRHHQARPDRPGFYFLVIKPKWYQVVYSDPTGVVASPHIPWDKMDLLVAYVYSHYNPPDEHLLWDETIRWCEPSGPCTFPSWEVKVQDQWYINGEFIFVGEPWGRLTTTFRALAPNDEHVIIKDSYRKPGRRFREEEILEHLHEEGDLLGVVRLKVYETLSRFGLKGSAAERLRVRFVLLDSGSEFETAKTVNDLLKAVYDALEVHRTKLIQRNVLHRDMSLYNVLMYPVWGSMEGRHVNEASPPMIQDILSGKTRAVADRFPECLTIDFDNAARLDSKNLKPQELMQRTGTPMYIARSVCKGRVLQDSGSRFISPMPELSGKALELYIRAHGQARYDRYNDTGLTLHGVPPPNPRDFTKPRPFFHRPEHDVESIYWSMLSALLHVRPANLSDEPEPPKTFVEAWNVLLSHRIPDAEDGYTDQRMTLLLKDAADWPKLFLGDMKGLGPLLSDISLQVQPEYAVCGDGLRPDHLHEAVQRLILQYLVDHNDNNIPLDPKRLRPIPQAPRLIIARSSKQVTAQGSAAGSGIKRETRGSSRRASENKDAGSGTKRKSATRDTAQSDGSAGSSASGARTAPVPNAIVIDPKRKSSSETGRSSKRLRNNSGVPESIGESGGEDDA